MSDYPVTSWSDEERGRVQFALLYSPTPRTVVTVGLSVALDEDIIGLSNRLPTLSEEQKARALGMADAIESMEAEIVREAGRAAGVTKVGEITRDQDKAIETRSAVVERMRARLADFIPWRINPAANTNRRTSSGGINASVSG